MAEQRFVTGARGVLGAFHPRALEDKVCIITGAASGQGRAAALRFAEAGARVFITDVNANGLQETAEAVEARAGEVPASLVADIASTDAGESIAAGAVAAYGRLDGVMNVAGIGSVETGTAVGAPTLESWQRMIDTNLRSMFTVSMAAIPHLRAGGGGSIVNFSSAAALRSNPNAPSIDYATSKGGVLSFTTSLAMYVAKDRIRVNAILPGMIATPFGGQFVDAARAALERGETVQPIPRLGEADDTAAVALFLMCDASSFITGAQISVDGGAGVERQSASWLKTN